MADHSLWHCAHWANFFPHVPRTFWLMALQPNVSGVVVYAQLFHESGRRLVHRYNIYRDPVPHPALRGWVINNLLDFVARTMAIAQLTHLHITIPASGMGLPVVPEECFPLVLLPRTSLSSRRVSFARDVAVLSSSPGSSPDRGPSSLQDRAVEGPEPVVSSDIQIHHPIYTLFPGEHPMDESPMSLYRIFRFLPPRRVSTGSSLLLSPIACVSPDFTDLDTFSDGVGHACCGCEPARGIAQPPFTWAAAAYNGIIHFDFIRCPGLSSQSGLARVSESCSALAFGPRGALPVRDFAFGFVRLWVRLFFSPHHVSFIGLHSAVWQIWSALASSSVFGVD